MLQVVTAKTTEEVVVASDEGLQQDIQRQELKRVRNAAVRLKAAQKRAANRQQEFEIASVLSDTVSPANVKAELNKLK